MLPKNWYHTCENFRHEMLFVVFDLVENSCECVMMIVHPTGPDKTFNVWRFSAYMQLDG